MGGIPTRNFRNLRYEKVSKGDLAGARVWLDNDYKLLIHDRKGKEPLRELFHLGDDPAEENNLYGELPEVVERLEKDLKEWQRSVLESLTGADYQG